MQKTIVNPHYNEDRKNEKIIVSMQFNIFHSLLQIKDVPSCFWSKLRIDETTTDCGTTKTT